MYDAGHNAVSCQDVTVMVVDGFDECMLIDCRTYPMRSGVRAMERQGSERLKRWFC